jgi:3-hydroxybutyryl-CoA dehydrogenase
MEDIKTIGIAGAGQMGRGIAHVCAIAGYPVLLYDLIPSSLTESLARIRTDLDRAVERANLTRRQAETALALIRPTAELDELGDVQLVIEAIPEDPALKEELFSKLHRVCQTRAVLASNTSSISITRLGAAAGRPAQVVGLHFMNPAPAMSLVEVVRGLDTSEGTLNLALDLAKRLGKTPVVAKDMPGFIVNRILIPMINEAIFALEKGVASIEDIDLAMTTGANHPVGPLSLADRIGLDTVLSICEILHRDLGDEKFRPCPLLRRYVEGGRLGRKTGRGFYVYEVKEERREALTNKS